MRYRISMLWLAAVSLLAGCATSYTEGLAALRQGSYSEAATRFEEALARDPDRIDAHVGLALSRYKLGEFDEAIAALDDVVTRMPTHATARLYLGLSHLQKAEYEPAEEHLGTLAGLKPGERLTAQIDRALRLTRGNDPLSDEMRAFVAASLEDGAELTREVNEVRAALRESELRRHQLYITPIYLVSRARCRC